MRKLVNVVVKNDLHYVNQPTNSLMLLLQVSIKLD